MKDPRIAVAAEAIHQHRPFIHESWVPEDFTKHATAAINAIDAMDVPKKPWQQMLLEADGIISGHSGEAYHTYYVMSYGKIYVAVEVIDSGKIHVSLAGEIEPFAMNFIMRYSPSPIARADKIKAIRKAYQK